MAFIGILTGEIVLTWPHRRANGSGTILIRSFLVSLVLYGLAFILNILLDYLTSEANKPFSVIDTSLLIVKATLPWFGAIFAAVYAALYTRFSSQWLYMAGVYNQIKATEAQVAASSRKDAADEVIASWKAAFIEDADELHLALKPVFAGLIRAWSDDKQVRCAFAKDALGGRKRLNSLLNDIDCVLQERAKDYEGKALAVSKGNPPVPSPDAS